MTLRDDAVRLVQALETILEGLKNYTRDGRQTYTREKALELTPHINNLRDAIFSSHSKEAAQRALDDMSELMHEINGAATKGEINFARGNALNDYWELQTVFREAKYHDQQL